MSQSQTGHVFISYSRRDDVVMRRIVKFLREQGLKVWVDNEKLIPGTPIWEREIEKAIKGANAAVVILSPDAKESVWVLNELTLVDEYRKRVFPILVRGEFRDAIPFRLATRQFVDIRTDETTTLRSLSKAISFHIEEIARQEEERKAEEKALAEKKAREEVERSARSKVKENRLSGKKISVEQKNKNRKKQTSLNSEDTTKKISKSQPKPSTLPDDAMVMDETFKTEERTFSLSINPTDSLSRPNTLPDDVSETTR